jgi:hypothetical protein
LLSCMIVGVRIDWDSLRFTLRTERRGRETDDRDRSPLKKGSSRKSDKCDEDSMVDYVLQAKKRYDGWRSQRWR